MKQEMFISGLDSTEIDLCNAVFCSDYKKVRDAINKGACPNIFIDGVSLLYIAIRKSFAKDKVRVIKELLCNGANPVQLFLCDTPEFYRGEPCSLPSVVELICTLPEVKEHEIEYSKLIQLLLNEFQCNVGWAYNYAKNGGLTVIAEILSQYSNIFYIEYPKDEIIEAIVESCR